LRGFIGRTFIGAAQTGQYALLSPIRIQKQKLTDEINRV
jgi:hypothetical protein